MLYSSKGAKSGSFTTSLSYLEVPILFGAAFPIDGSDFKPMVFAGPSVGLNLSCDDEGFDCKDSVNTLDFGLAIGAGFQYALESITLFLDGRYTFGLTNAADDLIFVGTNEDVTAKNKAWQFMAGVGFPIG